MTENFFLDDELDCLECNRKYDERHSNEYQSGVFFSGRSARSTITHHGDSQRDKYERDPIELSDSALQE